MPADHDTRHDTRPLGRTGIHVLPLGIGTNKWRRADRGAVLETYRTIHDAGPCMIDTAEIYFSERVVGDCLRAGPTRAVIASKFLPLPGRTSPRRLMSALDGSLARLGLKTIDLYYVHVSCLVNALYSNSLALHESTIRMAAVFAHVNRSLVLPASGVQALS